MKTIVTVALLLLWLHPQAAEAGEGGPSGKHILLSPTPAAQITAALQNRQYRNNSAFFSSFADSPVEPRSPRGAMLRSAVFPGWGQFYNHKRIKAALVFGVEAFFITSAILRNQEVVASTDPVLRSYWTDQRNNMVWALLATRLLSMLDAYVDAHLSDFDDSPDLSLQSPAQGVYLAFSWSWRF